jgi:hypothetical protein
MDLAYLDKSEHLLSLDRHDFLAHQQLRFHLLRVSLVIAPHHDHDQDSLEAIRLFERQARLLEVNGLELRPVKLRRL